MFQLIPFFVLYTYIGLNAPHASTMIRSEESMGGIDESTALLFHPGLGLSFRQQEQEEGLSSTTFPRLSSTSQSSSPSSSSSSASSSSSSVSYSSSLTLSFSANPHLLYTTSKNSNHPSSPTHTSTRPLPLNTTTSNNTSYSGTTASHLQQARELPSSSSPAQQPHLFILPSRSRSRSRDEEGTGVSVWDSPPVSPPCARMQRHPGNITQLRKNKDRKSRKQQKHQIRLVQDQICYELGKNARKENDAMVYLDGPRIYTCGECRTHLTSHDEIISKSFHGRHGKFVVINIVCLYTYILP
jgi:RhoGEF, Guanine nucleotide exchange factor for Rho/Rac/Cdc42-like GTPases